MMQNAKEFHLAQLRHAYKQLIEGRVTNQARLAKGLIGPAIEAFEQELDAEDDKSRRF
jgi:hypothetical protein